MTLQGKVLYDIKNYRVQKGIVYWWKPPIFKRLEYERSEYTKQLSNSIEDDRVRISRDLHDSIGQSLTLLTFDIVRVQREISTDQIQVHDLLTVMTAVTLKLTCGTGRCSLNSIVENNRGS